MFFRWFLVLTALVFLSSYLGAQSLPVFSQVVVFGDSLSDDGNIRHIDEIPQQMFARRLAHRSPIKHLYLCGSSTHPGGEVSGGPGYNAARTILQDLHGSA